MTDRSTTHTVRYEQPSPASNLPFNKVAQFVVGLVVIFVAVKLWWAGWFSWSIFEATGNEVPQDGYGNPLGLLPFIIDAVCLVGILTFTLLGMLKGAIGPVFSGLTEWVSQYRAEMSAGDSAAMAATQAGDTGERPPLDAAKIEKHLGKLYSRVKELKEWTERAETIPLVQAAVKPPEPPKPPTMEELASQLARVQMELEESKKANSLKKPTTRMRSTK